MGKSVNRRDIARQVAHLTNFAIKDVEEVLSVEDEVIAKLIEEGKEIKRHKYWKMDIEIKKAKRAYDGLKREYFYIPEKKIVKFKTLTQLNQAVDRLNANKEEEN